MSFLKRLGGRLPDFGEVVKRFPVATVIMALFTLWLIYENFRSTWFDDDYIFGAFILSGYVAVILRLIGEVRAWAFAKTTLIQIVLAGIAFGLAAFGERLGFNIPMAVAAAILFLGNASLWRLSRDDMRVWNFTQKLWTGAIFATVGSIIFVAGVFAITSALSILFDIRVDNLTEDIIIPIGLGFLAPLYWLGTLPKTDAPEGIEALSFEARALSFLGTWMLAPLLCIYALIVLAYGIKILVQWDFPKGEIATLVTPFLGIGMLVWLMLTPEILNKNGFVRFYRKVWHWVMIPAAIMLGLAVFVRVGAYGYTVDRLFLMLVFVWALIQGLSFTVMPRAARDIRIPTGFAAILLAIGAVIAEPLSVRSQFNSAMEAKQKLPEFTAENLKNNPDVAKQFLGGVEYLIKAEDEARFKTLLPNYDMPKWIYSDEWRTIKTELGLNEVGEELPYRTAYSIRFEGPLDIPENNRFFGPYKITLSENNDRIFEDSIIQVKNGFEATFDVGERTYIVDFGGIFDSADLRGGNSSSENIQIPVQPVRATDGTEAALLILSGYFADYREDNIRDANVEIALIVPN